MPHRIALIILTLIPAVALLVSCSTRQPVRQAARVQQAPNLEYMPPVPEAELIPAFPRYEKRPTHQAYHDGSRPSAFPVPQSLQPQVNFWRDVYASWSRSQVAIHDNLYLNVIYEVLDLPDGAREGLGSYQKEFIQDRMNHWKYRLLNLESKLYSGVPLDADDHRLSRLFAQSEDGQSAIRGASERLRYQRGMRERFKRGLEISGLYDRSFREIFRRAGLPEDLVYLPHVESSFQVNARSSAGAVGMWQFTAGAARMFMNGDDSARARLDPIASAHGAARYLSHAYDRLGSWPLAVTSYNHGIGGMKRAKDQYGHDFTRIVKDYDHPLFGFASRNYYAEFLAAREIANNPEMFFPEGVAYETRADWALSRFGDDDEIAGVPSAAKPRTAQAPMKVAKAGRVGPMRYSSSGAYRKVSQHSASKSRGLQTKKAIRAPAKSARHTTAGISQTFSVRSPAVVRQTATARQTSSQVRRTVVSMRTSPRRVIARP